MYCSKCGESNEENAKFCKKCGSKLEKNDKPTEIKKTSDKSKIIIIALVGVVIVLALCVIFAGGFLKGHVPLETKDFSKFEMDLPVGSDFVETDSLQNYGYGGYVKMENSGKYSKEVSAFLVSNVKGSSHPSQVSLERTEGDIKVFKDNEGGDLYFIERTVGDYTFSFIGKDDQTIIKILESIKVTGSSN